MLKYIVIALALMEAGWMVFDGSHALITGDYITPKQGRYAGQLGPWTKPVQAAGLDPRSTTMEIIFVAYGTLWLGIIVAFAYNARWARAFMAAAALGSLWYLPLGTLFSCLQLLLLYFISTRKVVATG
jgi:uncharacterized membrane protein YphA (DoxX/SURF4 family)